MIAVSTRGQAPAVSFGAAVAAGLAPDGGLYVPDHLPVMPPSWWAALRGRSFPDVAVEVAAALVGDEIGAGPLDEIVRGALNFPVPIVTLADDLRVVELTHGPTFAFKDVGARCLARLVAHLDAGSGRPIAVLVATSGDTGSAVAQAFHGVAGTRVVVLYPEGQVSPVQEAQFATLGGNVTAVAVAGAFDDCQRLAKEAFADRALAARHRLTSANSISLGRLLPQISYYAYAAASCPTGRPLIVSVPSGNFGNLTAGVMARLMGAPIDRFVAATTVNDTVPRYLRTGRVEPRPSVPTLANAMDVGHPSNLERLQWLFGGDVSAMRDVLTPSVHTDDEVRGAIAEIDRRYGYVADPHTAIAYLGATRAIGAEAGNPAPLRLFLATASPAKFRETVEPVLGRPVPLPRALAEAVGRPRLVQRLATPSVEALAALL